MLDDIPFKYSISNLTFGDISTLYYTFQATRPSKVACLISRSDSDVDKLIWNRSIHYFHSNRSYTEQVVVNGIVGQDSRLFCQVTDLSTDEFNTTYYHSNPFSIRCISINNI